MRTGRYDRAGNVFDWSDPARIDAHGVIPKYAAETTILEVKGVYNNFDAYVSADFLWIIAGGAGPTLFNLYALVDNAPYPILTNIDPTTLPSYTTTPGPAFQWRALIASVRGRPCDGFRLTVKLGTPRVFAGFNEHQGTGVGFAWGTETAPGTTVESGGAIDVRVTSPLPLPVSVSAPNPLLVAEKPVAVWGGGTNGTAPDIGGGPAVAIATAPAARYVEVSAFGSNTGTLYVGSTAFASSDDAEYELSGGAGAASGDSVRIPVNDAGVIFVAGSDASQQYRVAVV